MIYKAFARREIIPICCAPRLSGGRSTNRSGMPATMRWSNAPPGVSNTGATTYARIFHETHQQRGGLHRPPQSCNHHGAHARRGAER